VLDKLTPPTEKPRAHFRPRFCLRPSTALSVDVRRRGPGFPARAPAGGTAGPGSNTAQAAFSPIRKARWPLVNGGSPEKPYGGRLRRPHGPFKEIGARHELRLADRPDRRDGRQGRGSKNHFPQRHRPTPKKSPREPRNMKDPLSCPRSIAGGTRLYRHVICPHSTRRPDRRQRPPGDAEKTRRSESGEEATTMFAAVKRCVGVFR